MGLQGLGRKDDEGYQGDDSHVGGGLADGHHHSSDESPRTGDGDGDGRRSSGESANQNSKTY
jgi:hypothetical protein